MSAPCPSNDNFDPTTNPDTGSGERINHPRCGAYQLRPPDYTEHPALQAAHAAKREAEQLADEYRTLSPEAARLADAAALSARATANYLRRAIIKAGEPQPSP